MGILRLERSLMRKRRERWNRMVDALVDAKLVSRAKVDRVADDSSSRATISVAPGSRVLTQEPDELNTAATHHVRLTLQLWEPVVTAAGARQLQPLLAR